MKKRRGEKRPPDVVGNAVVVAKIATGEVVEKINNKAKTKTNKTKLKK